MEPIHQLFARVAESARDHIALRTPTTATTFGELLDGARRLYGVIDRPPGSRVAILVSDHSTLVASILGTLNAGCVFMPLDPSLSDEQLRRQLARVVCEVAIADEGTDVRLRSLAPSSTRIIRVPTAGSVETPPRVVDQDAACSVYFTSGSTGVPRAILGRLNGIDHHVRWEIEHLGLDAAVRGTVLHGPSYDAYLPDVFVPMCVGGTACAPERGITQDPDALCAWIEREEITLLHCVPSIFRSLLASTSAGRLRSLRYVLLAGEVVRPADVAAAFELLGTHLRLVNLYGPSEATLVKLHYDIQPTDSTRASIPIGRPMPGVHVTVVGDDRLPCKQGTIGEIAIRSPFGALGYVDEPALTAQRFLSNETYLTGDYGREAADGEVEFHGRRDRQIKLLGARVDLDEVETIVTSCEGVLEAAVVAVDETVLHGFVQLADGADLGAIRGQLSTRLSSAMRMAWLSRVASLPRTSTGKIDRRIDTLLRAADDLRLVQS